MTVMCLERVCICSPLQDLLTVVFPRLLHSCLTACLKHVLADLNRACCSYVMDVYMPRDRMNRAEHRGFGFVTFETEAAIIRVASYGGHMIRCVLTDVTCIPVLRLCHTMPCLSSLSRVMQNAMVLSLSADKL